ncbi:MAG TPA: hypothetical protein VM783_17080, partial [Candidatus Acidoferrum sp.]|nr:hypothetical protein [Candidatus Acidoferrum sp.]
HLKTCCIAQRTGALNADQFQVCMNGAKDYETKVVQVVTNIKEANAAEEQKKPELAKERAEQARQAASEAIKTNRLSNGDSISQRHIATHEFDC